MVKNTLQMYLSATGFKRNDVVDLFVQHTRYSISHRITSYNVCYTKLLRTQKEGIFKVETNETLVPFEPAFEHGLISTLFFGNGMLLVGSQEGLFEYQSGGRSDDFTAFPELNYIHVQVIKEAFNGNSYWVGTEDAGLYLLTIDSLTHSLVSVGSYKFV